MTTKTRKPLPQVSRERLPAYLRAGSRLDFSHDNCIEIFGPDYMTPVCTDPNHHHAPPMKSYGYIDKDKRLFQCGGEARNFILRIQNAVTMPLSVWLQVDKGTDYIEMIDNDANQCYRIETSVAAEEGHTYVIEINGLPRNRWSVPLGFWEISKEAGK